MSKFLFILISLLFIHKEVFAQKLDDSILCASDTLVLERKIRGTNNTIKKVLCEGRSKIGMRLDVGVAGVINPKRTQTWFGNYIGPNVMFSYAIGDFNLGTRVLFSSVDLKQPIERFNLYFPVGQRVDISLKDIFLSYSYNLTDHFTIEPSVAFSLNTFDIRKDQEFLVYRNYGFHTGVGINRYFELKKNKFLAIRLSTGFSYFDLTPIHPNLGSYSNDFTVGVAYKGYRRKQFYKIIDDDK